MRRFDGIGVFMVSDGPGQFQNAVKSPRRKIQLLHRRFQQVLCRIFYLTVFPDIRRRHIGVAVQFGAFKSFLLPLSAGGDTCLDFLRFFPQSVVRQFFVIDARHLDKDINPVEERPADSFLVAGDSTLSAGALFEGVAKISAGTSVKKRTATSNAM